MKKLHKNFQSAENTVEAMAVCQCASCYCNSNCTSPYNWVADGQEYASGAVYGATHVRVNG